MDSLRSDLAYGYVSFTGVTWTNSQVDRYNAVSDRINAAINAGVKVPESLLNDSHALCVLFSTP